MTAAEFLLWAALGYIFWSKKLQKRFPAMSTYLGIRVFSMPILFGAFYLQSRPGQAAFFFPVYFYSYWAVYIASAITLFLICTELFRTALAGFSGLMRFGIVIFRWAAIVSAVSSLASLSFAHKGILIIPEIGYGLMRTVSIVELCLLAFLCLAMNALQLSVRDLVFGIALGFGMMSSSDFIVASLMPRYTDFGAAFQYVGEGMILATLLLWAVYVAVPERARQPIVVAANSTIYRWNEIASALGHKGTKVAVPAPANSFFLSDVEKVVDKVLTRNLRESETNS
jgi:hypothetical protein